MEVPSDDAVLIQKGKKPGEPHVITVNCPDKHGLGCDICRIILDFGLYITKGGLFFAPFCIYGPLFIFLLQLLFSSLSYRIYAIRFALFKIMNAFYLI